MGGVLSLDYYKEFDAIWACSSFLHFNKSELITALKSCFRALMEEGIMQTPFKIGSSKETRNDRYFHDFEITELFGFVKIRDFKK